MLFCDFAKVHRWREKHARNFGRRKRRRGRARRALSLTTHHTFQLVRTVCCSVPTLRRKAPTLLCCCSEGGGFFPRWSFRSFASSPKFLLLSGQPAISSFMISSGARAPRLS